MDSRKTSTNRETPIVIGNYTRFGSLDEDTSTDHLNHPHDLETILNSTFVVRNIMLKEFLAEIFGTFMFLTFALGSVAQFKFSGKNSFFSVNVSFGLSLTLAILTVGKVSGGHLNPAVSLSMLLLGRISYFKFWLFVIGQSLGAFLASLVVFLIYLNQIEKMGEEMFSLDTAGIFATYPVDLNDTTNTFSNFCDQFFATGLFIIGILAITDRKNWEIPNPLCAILIGLDLLVVGASFGLNCGFAVNPARDFAPRLFTAMIGWGSKTFTAGNYFFWIPIVAPMLGSTFGTCAYYFFIANHWPIDEFQSY